MRYLVFNLLVVGALAFLLFDGDPPKTVRGAVDKVAVEADRLIAKGKALVGKATTERPVGRTPPVTRTSLPKSNAPAEDSRDQSVAVVPGNGDRAIKPVPSPGPRAAPVESVADASRPATVSPRPVKPRYANDAPTRALDPAVARRRAEVLGEVPRGAATVSTATAEFMAPRVRRSELNKLAEDMELMFVEKAGR